MRQTVKEMLEGTDEVINHKKVGNNTLKIKYQDGTTAIRLHNTNIITTTPDEKTTLNTGGYFTRTTKERLSEWTSFGFQIRKGQWYIRSNGKEYIFYDGITFDKNGNLVTSERKDKSKEIAYVKDRVRRFVKLIDTIKEIPLPDNGDCWYCLMKEVKTGKPLGELTGDVEHLKSHMQERYIHGSLLVNAMKHCGYNDMQISLHLQMPTRWLIKNALRKYLNDVLVKDILKRKELE